MEMTPKVQDSSRGVRPEIFPELVRDVGTELRRLLSVVETDSHNYNEECQQDIKLAQKVNYPIVILWNILLFKF